VVSGGCNQKTKPEQGPHSQRTAIVPQATRASDWDAYRRSWRRAEKLELLTDFPLHLDIELAGTCNLKCDMCWQAGDLTASLGVMDDDLFKKMIVDGVDLGLCAVKLQSRGESLLHPRIGELARFAKEAGVLDLQLTTNATLFSKPHKIDSILSSGIDKLIFSIDDEHDESARKIYGDAAPDVRALFREIVFRRNRSGQQKPLMRIQTFAPSGMSQEDRLAEVKKEFPEADEYLVNVLWNSSYAEESVAGLAQNYEFFPCSYLWTRLSVFWNGDVTTCCRDYNCTMKLGNVGETNIGDIWLGPGMTEMRQSHQNGERQTLEICANCDISTKKIAAEQSETFIWEKDDE